MSRAMATTQVVSRNNSIASNPEWKFPYNDPAIDGFEGLWNNMNNSEFQGFDGIESTDYFDDFDFQDYERYFGTDADGSASNANQLTVAASRRASAQMIIRPFAAVPLDTQNLVSSSNYTMHASVDPRLQDPSYQYNPTAHETVVVEQVQKHYRNHPAAYLYDSDLQPSIRVDTTPKDDPRRLSTGSSDLSEASSLKKSRRARTKHANTTFVPEKPKMDGRAWWVRINTITEGKTSRTGKINQYDANQVYGPVLPHPLGEWSGRKTRFGYNKFGELSEKTYTAREIREFIYEHPHTKDCKLKLWIQKSPADSARRYRTPDLSKCRFQDCPVQRDMKGTIIHGQYRVAFDEKWYKYRLNADPFLTAGYVHLYCMERFLNFPDICKKLDIEVDVRHMVNEPKQRFAATLAGSIEASVASSFLEACREGLLDKKYPNYPIHGHYSHGAPKPHEHTLTYAMNKAKLDTRPPAQIRQFEARGVLDSNVVVHLGDLEKFVAAKLQSKRPKKSRRKRAREADSDSEAEEVEEIVLRPCKQRNTKGTREAPQGYTEQTPPLAASGSRRRSLRSQLPANYMEPGPSSTSHQDTLFMPDYSQFGPPAPQAPWDMSEYFQEFQPTLPPYTEKVQLKPSPLKHCPPPIEPGHIAQFPEGGVTAQDSSFTTYCDFLNNGYDCNYEETFLPRRVSRFKVGRRRSSTTRKVITGERKEWVSSSKSSAPSRRCSARINNREGLVGSLFFMTNGSQ